MSISSSSKLYSHPNKALEEHLINVANLAEENMLSVPAQIPGGLCKYTLVRLIRACALCHDLGKATSFFQRYLFATGKEKEHLKVSPQTNHSLLGAMASYFMVMSEFEEDLSLGGEERAFLSFLAFLIVKRHHGNLEDVLYETILSEKSQSLLLQQIESIDEDKFSGVAEKLCQHGLKYSIKKELLRQWATSFPKELRSVKRQLRRLEKNKQITPYLVANLLFSILIDSDKSEVVVGKSITRGAIELYPAMVDNYKASFEIKPSPINFFREKAYQELLSKPVDLSNRVLSINLPTGLGKTLSSFSYALKLRNAINDNKNFIPRIIYCLPFLSIIEQNADHFEKLLLANELDPDTNLILKHHHLSELNYKKGDDEFETDQAKILVEGWNSEIVITTFVQLFHTLFSSRNKNLRKFHRLAGSIIILDEVQSIPFKYWLLVRELLKTLTEVFDSYVVFVTATEPLIFNRDEIKPLVNREFYFSAMDRVSLKPSIDRDVTLEEFIQGIKLEPDKSYLFILNTIKSAKAFYELIKTKVEEHIVFLSTHVVPEERLERIQRMRDKKVRIAVTTQLVEAGVDVDFDVVYRDMAPLDSINQAAGRCNRNGNTRGEVIVISLADERKPYSSYIYDPVLLEITRSILAKKEEIPESQFMEIINNYYDQVMAKKSSDVSRELLGAIFNMKYDSVDGTTSIADFRLIDNDYPKLEVFIELNDFARNVWTNYTELKEIKDIFKRRLAFSKIKADFYKYIISIPVNIDNLPPEVYGFMYVNRNTLTDYYDKDTGFKCEGGIALW